MYWLYALGYLVAGIVFTVWVGREDFFDYSPTREQISPGVLKYLFILVWPLLLFVCICEGVFDLAKVANRKFNELLNVRVDKR